MHGMHGMHSMHKKHRMNENDDIDDIDEIDLQKINNKISSKKIISYIKNPLLVFIIFILLNSSIIIKSIDNVFVLCSSNNNIASIINLIVRGILASLLYFIISSLLKNI